MLLWAHDAVPTSAWNYVDVVNPGIMIPHSRYSTSTLVLSITTMDTFSGVVGGGSWVIRDFAEHIGSLGWDSVPKTQNRYLGLTL